MNDNLVLNSDKQYLIWLKQRLKFKYKEDDNILSKLEDIIRNKKIVNSKIDISVIDKVCNKFWPNFDGTNTSDIIGISEYTEKEKDDIRKYVMLILNELNKEICYE